MNVALFRRTVRAKSFKLTVASTALAVWGVLLPIIYARFGSQFREIMDTGIFPKEFAERGGGDIFTLPGSIALGSRCFSLHRRRQDGRLLAGRTRSASARCSA